MAGGAIRTGSRAWRSSGAKNCRTASTLALAAVATVNAGGRQLYVAGGQQLDQDFLSTLVLPAGMRVLLYRNLEPQFAPHLLAGAADAVADAAEFQPLIERVIRERRPRVATLGSGAAAETVHALPLTGIEDNLLGVLLIASSRRDLVELENSLGRTGAWVAAGAILIGMVMSAWATARVTRPVRRLAESAGQVAAGNWNTTVEVTSQRRGRATGAGLQPHDARAGGAARAPGADRARGRLARAGAAPGA